MTLHVSYAIESVLSGDEEINIPPPLLQGGGINTQLLHSATKALTCQPWRDKLRGRLQGAWFSGGPVF